MIRTTLAHRGLAALAIATAASLASVSFPVLEAQSAPTDAAPSATPAADGASDAIVDALGLPSAPRRARVALAQDPAPTPPTAPEPDTPEPATPEPMRPADPRVTPPTPPAAASLFGGGPADGDGDAPKRRRAMGLGGFVPAGDAPAPSGPIGGRIVDPQGRPVGPGANVYTFGGGSLRTRSRTRGTSPSRCESSTDGRSSR